MEKRPATYIVANKRHGTLYIGVTSNLIGRIYQHKNGVVEGFTQKYDCKILVYFEVYETMEQAITREKQLKGKSRQKKIALIESLNPSWNDLYNSIWA